MSVRRTKNFERVLAANEAEFHVIVEQNADGAAIVDFEGTIGYLNPAAAAMFGRSREDLLGEPFPAALAPGDTVEINLPDPEAGCRTVEMRAVPIDWHGRPAHLVSLRDVTERRRREEEARQAVRRRDQFLAMLSHELRNPLAAIVNASRILQRGTSDDRALRRAREVIDAQSRQMTRLLDDLLDVSRICLGKAELRKEILDLREPLQQAVQSVLPLIAENRLEIDVDLPDESLYVLGDPTRLNQIFTNILTNAAKYTEPGGHVWLAARRDRAEIIVRVRDRGIGIDPDNLESIFEPFVQEGVTLARSDGGMGIGLALVRRLVDMHGGTVLAESKGLGHGSTFTVRLPEAAPASPAAPKSPPDSDISGMRILIVEDNANAREMLQAVLELDGHEVAVAESGRQGLEMIDFQRPEIALVDIGLPELDGYQLARLVRENPENDGVFLVALTGYGQPDDRRQALAAGFDAHMVKPVDMERLQEIFADRRRK